MGFGVWGLDDSYAGSDGIHEGKGRNLPIPQLEFFFAVPKETFSGEKGN